MKKQIFILVFLVLATSAYVTKSYGQALAPRALNASCAPVNSPLTPYVGTLYNYAVDVPVIPSTGLPWTNTKYHWFVTQQTSFITGGSLTTDRITASLIVTNGVYNSAINAVNTIPITWTSAAASSVSPYYLVVYVKGDGAACSALNNLKVYEIKPVKSFLLDIANMSAVGSANISGTWVAGLAPENNICASPIASASYNTGTKKMVYQYGINYLYIAVTAANFGTDWDATFHLDGVRAGQNITAVEWTRADAFTGLSSVTTTTAAASGVQGVYTLNVPAVSSTSTALGETIYIRVTVDNNTFEGLTDVPLTFAVDGRDADGNADLHYADCNADGFTHDWVKQTIMARLTVNSTPATTPFLVP